LSLRPGVVEAIIKQKLRRATYSGTCEQTVRGFRYTREITPVGVRNYVRPNDILGWETNLLVHFAKGTAIEQESWMNEKFIW